MKIPLASYGKTEILLSTVILLAAAYFSYLIHPGLVIIPALLLGFVFYFFRNPERVITPGDDLILSPADGTIIEIKYFPEDQFVKTETVKVTIFLSVFNVHINRSPYEGKVAWIDYHKGEFLVASKPDASTRNECNNVGLVVGSGTSGFKILVRQIAGIIAQRIVCGCKVNDVLAKGQVFGMIKFGSRTEICIPKDKVKSVEIKLGDKVKAGQTIIARIR
ncbi:MAG: phosphatidylserine decarboxylase family protein [Candidatus Brocadiia bacterium]